MTIVVKSNVDIWTVTVKYTPLPCFQIKLPVPLTPLQKFQNILSNSVQSFSTAVPTQSNPYISILFQSVSFSLLNSPNYHPTSFYSLQSKQDLAIVTPKIVGNKNNITWPSPIILAPVTHLSERRSRKFVNPIRFRGVDAVVPHSIAHPALPVNPDFYILGQRSREIGPPVCSIIECHRPLWVVRLAPRPHPLPLEDTPQTFFV